MILKIFMVIVQNLVGGASEQICIWEVGGVAEERAAALR